MRKNSAYRSRRRKAKREALQLLRSPRFLNEFLSMLKKQGLVGEELNALALFIVAVSRLLRHPLHVFVKARSSAGKNFLTRLVLRSMPRNAVTEITSVSDKAWNYLDQQFRHTLVYLQELNKTAGNMEPLRLLISEDKLTRLVTGWNGKNRTTERHTALGPVASISTTTKNQLQVDDETRHISIRVDESPEQTRRIVKSCRKPSGDLSRHERRTWRMVHRFLEKRIGCEIEFPEWFDEIAERIDVNDLRVRRYYPAFLEACRTVCLIRSFRSNKMRLTKLLEVDFTDFAIAALIFDQIFVESLRRSMGANEHTRQQVARLSSTKHRPIGVKDLARSLKISKDQAYGRLRRAAAAGRLIRANKSEKGNRKLFIAAPPPRFVPDPEVLFHKLKMRGPVRFVHPISGERVEYCRKD